MLGSCLLIALGFMNNSPFGLIAFGFISYSLLNLRLILLELLIRISLHMRKGCIPRDVGYALLVGKMAKKKERSVNVSGKPKHSLDVNRDGGKTKSSNGRSAATVRRLKMYNTRPTRDSKGKILKHDLQSKELPSTRIMPDRRWFGNTRVVNQKELEFFREELQNRLSSNYNFF
ncbi:UNVERIFIED_CONTAM: Nuclear/nucleolar GTPase 2 [Sesamum calycinum]|uniref:Nuclear/nucleolar GTPase 2 n=1 Tax=Sesamum calycinum TaxID=2727403 RepID=A0AAW2RQB5_9LAMI